ncbi:MAG TPA: hypothetical protein VMV69_29330 [Pirellulales bacterium]|nr:hypothetical protein [Pirellulales bacterium]
MKKIVCGIGGAAWAAALNGFFFLHDASRTSFKLRLPVVSSFAVLPPIVLLVLLSATCVSSSSAAADESAADTLGLMYWTHRNEGVYRAARDGSEVKLIVPMKNVDGLAIDLENRKLYWTETGTICQGNFDGSGIEVLVSGKTEQYASLVILPPKE